MIAVNGGVDRNMMTKTVLDQGAVTQQEYERLKGAIMTLRAGAGDGQ